MKGCERKRKVKMILRVLYCLSKYEVGVVIYWECNRRSKFGFGYVEFGIVIRFLSRNVREIVRYFNLEFKGEIWVRDIYLEIIRL